MANNRIQIKRSPSTATPSSLQAGELAFSNVTGGSGVLFIGSTDGGTVVPIAGVRNPGTLTANQALVANSTSGINQVIVGNLAFTGATQNILANGSVGTAGFVLASGGTGSNLYWTSTGSFSVNTAAQYIWTNTHTFQNTVTFGANLIVDTTSLRWVGNTSTSPTVTFANSGAFTIGNSSTTQSTGIISIANSITNSQLSSASLFLGNSTVNSIANSSTFRVAGNTTTLASAALSSSGLLLGNDSVTSTSLVVSVSNSLGNTIITPGGIRLGNTTVNTQIEPFSGSILQNWYTNTTVYNQAQFGGLDSYTTVSLSQTTGSNTTTVNSAANDISSSIYSGFYGSGAFGGRAIYGTNSSSGFIGLWSNTTPIQVAPAFTDYTINGLRANSTALVFGNSVVNSTSNSSTFQVTGNTTTLASAALSSSGLALGNSSVTSTSLVASVANNVGNVQITPISMRVANTTVSTFIANTTQVTISGIPLSANGGIGSQGQVLASNGTTGSPYWTTPTTGTVTGVAAGNGLFSGGTSAVPQLDVGAGNGISVSADAVAVLANSGLVANATGLHVVAGNNQLVSNTTGVWVDQTKIDHNSLTNYDANRHIDHTAVSITAGNGLTGGGTIAATRTLTAVGANGISVTASGINVLAGNSGVISNASGVFVNAATFSIATSQLSGDVALGTQTSGNYVATVAAGNGMVVAGSGSETAAVTVSVLANTGVVANSTGIFIGQPVSTSSNVTFANVVTTLLTVNGNTNLGDAAADKINTFGSFSNGLIPDANVSYNIGTNALRWNEIHASNVHSVVGYFDSNLNVGGDLIVTGNLVTQNVQSVVISDPMIYLAGNNYTSDLVDIGLSANYYDGSTQRHTGFFRDATDGIWKLFANSTQELSGNNVVNTAAVGYTTATLVTYLTSGGLVTNATSVYVTANSTVNVNISANVISLSGRANNDLLFANSTGGITGLALNTTGGYVLQTNGTAIVYDYLDGGTF